MGRTAGRPGHRPDMPLAADVHTIAIPLHALSATGAFIFGAFLIFQDRDSHRRLRLGEALVLPLLLMDGFLVTAVLRNPAGLPIIALIIFGVLPLLGVYMIYRAVRALLGAPEGKGESAGCHRPRGIRPHLPLRRVRHHHRLRPGSARIAPGCHRRQRGRGRHLRHQRAKEGFHGQEYERRRSCAIPGDLMECQSPSGM